MDQINYDDFAKVEFKIGETAYLKHNINQVWDYALDLKNFHAPSHKAIVVPVLVATEAENRNFTIATTSPRASIS